MNVAQYFTKTTDGKLNLLIGKSVVTLTNTAVEGNKFCYYFTACAPNVLPIKFFLKVPVESKLDNLQAVYCKLLESLLTMVLPAASLQTWANQNKGSILAAWNALNNRESR